MAILYACCRCRFFLYAVVASIFFFIINCKSDCKSANAALMVSVRSCLVSSIVSTIISTIAVAVGSYFGVSSGLLLLVSFVGVGFCGFFFSVVGVCFVGVGVVVVGGVAAATNAETGSYVGLSCFLLLLFVLISVLRGVRLFLLDALPGGLHGVLGSVVVVFRDVGVVVVGAAAVATIAGEEVLYFCLLSVLLSLFL